MWSDEQCTQKPVVGQSYSTLYVKLHRAFGENEAWESEESYDGQAQLIVSTPTTENPDNLYQLLLYMDFVSNSTEDPLEVNQVVPVTADDISLGEGIVFDFYK